MRQQSPRSAGGRSNRAETPAKQPPRDEEESILDEDEGADDEDENWEDDEE